MDLLVKAGADLDAQDFEGSTPLFAASCGLKSLALTEALLARGADPNVRDGQGRKAADLFR